MAAQQDRASEAAPTSGKGWSLTLAYRHYLVGNRGERTSQAGSEMITFGLGYNQ
jgi:hypothetical protein